MYRLLPAIAVIPVVLAGCPIEIVEGDGDIVDREVEVAAFTAVHVGNGLCAHISEGETGPVVLRGDANLLERLEVAVDEEGALHVEPFDQGEVLIPSGDCLKVIASTPQLVDAHASGGAEIVAESLVGDQLQAHASGGAQIFVGAVEGDELDVELSGGSRALLRGAVDVLTVEASGGSVARLSLLEARAVRVDLSGGSRAEIVAEEAVIGDASGGSTVVVSGDPGLATVDTSGGSSVELD
jgi:hypothetical protein